MFLKGENIFLFFTNIKVDNNHHEITKGRFQHTSYKKKKVWHYADDTVLSIY